MAVGVSIDDLIEACVIAYRWGYNDAIRQSIESEKIIDNEAMKIAIREQFIKEKKIKNVW